MNLVLYLKGERGASVFSMLTKLATVRLAVVLEKSDKTLLDVIQASSIPFTICSQPKLPEHERWLKLQKPDLICAVGYSKILPQNVINIPVFGAINCHAGRLPNYRGASPIPWQILSGETLGEAYVLRMTSDIDNGPILAREEYEIHHEETARDIVSKVNDIFTRIVPHVINSFISGVSPPEISQEEAGSCIWTRRTPEDGNIDWSRMRAQEVINLIRALDDPYPGAFTYCGAHKITIHRGILLAKKICGVPGRYVGYRYGVHAIVALDQAIGLASFSVNEKKTITFPGSYGATMRNWSS